MIPQWRDFVKYATIGQGPVEGAARPAATTKSPAPIRPIPRRVGGRHGAQSTGWDPNYKPPVKYRAADPAWTPAEKKLWEREQATLRARDKRYEELRKRYPNGNIPILELRRAYYGN